MPISVHTAPVSLRWTTNEVSVIELSFHEMVTVLVNGSTVRVRPSGLSGGRTRLTGRIMSISSWDRMWQW